ncbi:hypothetical protein H6G97_41875 [Nostoc flagelliforme FACHB-838]|uniref:Aminoglycoside phosphotransferase n=1 Tax=Nostoc flagelliforme FACHB-838 TaxID=2692904 RepID=A0ABR8E3C0_9NOSO|nr:hypothetical protein [Nostoc flagelliforme]MBD2535586.1 hypothetical protein [Nostoc flagelliforme FACHB-838]
MNQKTDLLSQVLDPEKLLALVATHLNVEPVKLQLVPMTTGKHNSSFWVVAPKNRFVLRLAPKGLISFDCGHQSKKLSPRVSYFGIF